jgi:glycosyltransferase 2 family protein
VVVALVGAALYVLRDRLPEVRAAFATTRLRWGLVALASLIVLATYALLIEGWRLVLAAAGGVLGRGDAARIWFVSSLARYIPGMFWALGAMTEMARRRGVPVTVSTSSAVVITIVNLFTGVAVATAFLATTPSMLHTKGRVVLTVGALVLMLMPAVTPHLVRLARQVTGRELVIPRVGLRPVVIAAISTTLSWLAYGVAFWIMTRAVLPGEWRDLPACIAIYTAYYLTGLLNPAPAGIGAAEGAMVLLAPRLGVATTAEAAVLSIIVRVWRTALEVLPGLVALALGGSRDPLDAQPSRGSRIP